MRILPAILTLTLAVTAQLLPKGRVLTITTKLTSLSPARQRTLLHQLRPAYLQYAKQSDDDLSDIQMGEKEVVLLSVPTPSGPLLFVHGDSSTWCGIAGNCVLWVYDSHKHLLLTAIAQDIVLLPQLTNGRPNIAITTHHSSGETGLDYWVFTGTRYERKTCANETFFDAKTPKNLEIIPYPCPEK